MAYAIRPDEILDLGDYERSRADLRSRAMAARAARRVAVGPSCSVTFECRDTVRYQIQEMLRAERIADEAGVAHEIETYSELLPGPAELSATLMLEFPEAKERAVRLEELVGIENHVWLVAGGERVAARFDGRQIDPERVSAVQFVRFPLGDRARAALGAGGPVRLEIDHPRYAHGADLRRETVAALALDLAEAAG